MTEHNLDKEIHDALFHKTEAEKRQAIKALIATQIQEARIDELQSLNMNIIGYKTKDQVQEVLTDRIAQLRSTPNDPR